MGLEDANGKNSPSEAEKSPEGNHGKGDDTTLMGQMRQLVSQTHDVVKKLLTPKPVEHPWASGRAFMQRNFMTSVEPDIGAFRDCTTEEAREDHNRLVKLIAKAIHEGAHVISMESAKERNLIEMLRTEWGLRRLTKILASRSDNARKRPWLPLPLEAQERKKEILEAIKALVRELADTPEKGDRECDVIDLFAGG